MMRYKQTGLTMIEILVTLSIASILAVVAIPALSDLVESGQADSDASSLFTSLLLARSESATRNSMVTLCKIDPASPTSCDNSVGWQSGWIAFADVDSDGTLDIGEVILHTSTGMSENAIVTSTDYPNVIRFLPSGGVTTNGSLTICVGGNFSNTVLINATGRPRIADSVCP